MNIEGISVVIPLYNKENFIEKTIQTVLNQSYKKYEIVVVDDGSFDNSVSIVKNMSDERIKIIKQNNLGVSIARNNGIHNAKYKHVAFLDADDEWFPNHLEELVRLYSLYPDAALWVSGYQRSDKSKESEHVDKLYDIDNYLTARLNGTRVAWTSAVMVSKENFWEKKGFMKNHNHGEDQALWLDLVSTGIIAKSFNITAQYNIFEGSLSSKLLQEDDACMIKIDEIMQRKNISNKTHKLLYEFKCFFAISHSINALIHKDRIVFKYFLDKYKNTGKFRIKKTILSAFYYVTFIFPNLAYYILENFLRVRKK